MPAAEIRRRGGATRVRTIQTGKGTYRHVYVVREAGPQGGHTVAGEEHRTKPGRDRPPHYRMKPTARRG